MRKGLRRRGRKLKRVDFDVGIAIPDRDINFA